MLPQSTERIELCRLTPNHLDETFEMDLDPEVRRYLGRFEPNRQDCLAWLERTKALYQDIQSPLGFFAAMDRLSGEYMGWFTLRPALHYRMHQAAGLNDKELELGYRFKRKFWNQGLATEGSRSLLAHAHNQKEFDAIVAIAYQANKGSTRVMEKIGMTFDRTVFFPNDEEPLSVYRFDLIPAPCEV